MKFHLYFSHYWGIKPFIIGVTKLYCIVNHTKLPYRVQQCIRLLLI